MVKSDILGKLKSIFTNEKNKQNKIFSYRRFTFNIFLIVLILILVIQIYFKINKLDGILTIDIMSVLLLTLLYSAIFLSLALGLNLTYKILGFANFSHAEFLTIGGYFAIFLQLTPWFTKSIDGAPEGILREHLLIYAMIIGFFGTGLIAVIIDYLVYRPLRKRDAKPDTMMIASLGVALVIRGLLYVRFTGANSYFVPPEGEIIEVHELKTIKIRIFLGSKFFDSELVKTGSGCVGTILCTFNFKDLFWFLIKIIILTTILLFIFINYTKTGKAMRAVADNVDLAASSGINVERIRILTWFIGGGIAGMAGVVWSALFKISPITGSIYLLAAFAVIVLGSIGSLEGGVIASLIIGFARALSYPILAGLGNPLNRNAMSSYVDVIPFAILILILLFYSDGIGERIKQRKIELARIELRNAELGIVTHKSFIKRFFNQFFMELQFGIIKFIAIITFLSKYIINPLKQVKTKFIIMLSPLTNIITLSIQNIKNIIYKLRKTISRKFGKYSLNNFQPFSSRYPMGLRDESFQNNLFILFIIFILILILNLPASNEDNRRMIFLLGFFITWIIFAILALSLNFHTGITGLVNFGVVFFAGIGAITTSLYSFHNKNIFIG
ncbi:MAG: hypothetical protein OEZ01_11420, partial [Candidatus Heimdallarchaeota archaeon]|nr:hypothetical protein [Candidatus Heimdallarchaeota archaeon]